MSKSETMIRLKGPVRDRLDIYTAGSGLSRAAMANLLLSQALDANLGRPMAMGLGYAPHLAKALSNHDGPWLVAYRAPASFLTTCHGTSLPGPYNRHRKRDYLYLEVGKVEQLSGLELVLRRERPPFHPQAEQLESTVRIPRACLVLLSPLETGPGTSLLEGLEVLLEQTVPGWHDLQTVQMGHMQGWLRPPETYEAPPRGDSYLQSPLMPVLQPRQGVAWVLQSPSPLPPWGGADPNLDQFTGPEPPTYRITGLSLEVNSRCILRPLFRITSSPQLVPAMMPSGYYVFDEPGTHLLGLAAYPVLSWRVKPCLVVHNMGEEPLTGLRLHLHMDQLTDHDQAPMDEWKQKLLTLTLEEEVRPDSDAAYPVELPVQLGLGSSAGDRTRLAQAAERAGSSVIQHLEPVQRFEL